MNECGVLCFSTKSHTRFTRIQAPVNPYSGQPIGELYTIITGNMGMALDWYCDGSADYDVVGCCNSNSAYSGYKWLGNTYSSSEGTFLSTYSGAITRLNTKSSSAYLKKMETLYGNGQRIVKLAFDRAQGGLWLRSQRDVEQHPHQQRGSASPARCPRPRSSPTLLAPSAGTYAATT